MANPTIFRPISREQRLKALLKPARAVAKPTAQR
jgi:hypothetical protein